MYWIVEAYEFKNYQMCLDGLMEKVKVMKDCIVIKKKQNNKTKIISIYEYLF